MLSFLALIAILSQSTIAIITGNSFYRFLALIELQISDVYGNTDHSYHVSNFLYWFLALIELEIPDPSGNIDHHHLCK